MAGRLDDRVDGGHQRQPHERRTEPVDALTDAYPGVIRDERPAEGEGGRTDRQVDEEDPVPVECLGQRAAGKQAERSAGERRRFVFGAAIETVFMGLPNSSRRIGRC